MDFLQLARDRYSVRKFNGKPLAQSDIDKILQVGLLAPTACNFQPQRVLVINSEDGLGKLKKCTPCHFDAPCVMLVCHNTDECWTREYDGKKSGDIDAAIVTTHMMLEAASIGVGSTWVMVFDPKAIAEEFALPANCVPTALLVMGYPHKDAAPSPRHAFCRPKDELIKQA